MRIGIAGSRDFPDMPLVGYVLACINEEFENVTIVHGGARGVDTEAGLKAREYGYEVEEIRPDFSKGYDVKQYHLRNDEIINSVDKMIVFWDGKSPGTKSVIKKCLDRFISIEIHFPRRRKA